MKITNRIITFLIFSFFLIVLSSCGEVVFMSDIEIILIDEEISLIEYQDSQLRQMENALYEEIECDCEINRVIDGRINQETVIFVIEFSKRSEAIYFERHTKNDEIVQFSDFKYAIRKGHIIILSDSLEILALFDNI